MKQKQNLKPGNCEKPQGVGFLFLLASLKNTGKKPHPPGAFPEEPLYFPLKINNFQKVRYSHIPQKSGKGVLREKPHGGGVFFHVFQMRLAKK